MVFVNDELLSVTTREPLMISVPYCNLGRKIVKRESWSARTEADLFAMPPGSSFINSRSRRSQEKLTPCSKTSDEVPPLIVSVDFQIGDMDTADSINGPSPT